ncbi:MAG: hypothetical protein Q9174_004150 [Haloplaca sp. 1 TL-2023]
MSLTLSRYGVSRVYLQQCGYILSDAQNVQTNMRVFSKMMRTASLDPNAGKARPDQLVLEDDPAFDLDLGLPGLDIDLAALDIATDASSYRSSLLSPSSHRTSLSSQPASEESMLGLQIPSSAGDAGDLGGFIVPSSAGGSVRRGTMFSDLRREADEQIRGDEDDYLLNPGFMFDDEGNMVFAGEEAAPASQQPVNVGRLRSDSAASAHVRGELEEGRQAGQAELRNLMDVDLNFPTAEDEDLILPQAEPFPSAGKGFLQQEDYSSSEAAAARQQRKPRGPKVLPVDDPQELRHSVLSQWNDNYLANMQETKKAKAQRKDAADAKGNAAYFVFGAGIGGCGVGRGLSNMKSPLADMFSGEALMRRVTGASTLKRSHDGSQDLESDSEERRVRMREAEGEVGRGQGLNLEDDNDMALPTGHDDEIELGRNAPAAMEDTSLFPWNRSASARDSRSRQGSLLQGFGSSIGGGFATSAGRLSSLPPVPGSMDRRASRITSASPLVGRGSRDFGFDDNEIHGGPSTSVVGDDFEIYGPAVEDVDTQTAAQSQWVRKALDAESSNFLEFVKTEIAERNVPAEVDGEGEEQVPAAEPKKSVAFEELLPPSRNTRIVAAQGLLHTLTLATKGLVWLKQEEDWGAIEIGVEG